MTTRNACLALTALHFLCVCALSFEPPVYDGHQDLSYYLDEAGQRRPIETQDDWAKRKAHVLAGLEATMGKLPRPEHKVPLDVKVVETRKIGPITRHKLAYHTDSAEQTVLAWLLLPARADGQKLPAMLCLHQTVRIGKDEPAGLSDNQDLDYAWELAERGYVTLSPDYPSFGEYKYDFDSADGYQSGSMKAVWDNIRAIDLLSERPEVDSARIGCIGHSLGGHNTMFTAAFEPRIKALVSNCGFCTMLKDDLPSWTGKVYMPLIASRYGNDVARLPWDFGEVAAAFAPRAFLASAAKGDDDFDWTGVADAVAVAAPIYDLHAAADNLQANYFDGPHAFPPAARQRAYEFLDKHLHGP
ncbi:MAG: alpha/beta hydrolase family protein [Pirellulales bacterium]